MRLIAAWCGCNPSGTLTVCQTTKEKYVAARYGCNLEGINTTNRKQSNKLVSPPEKKNLKRTGCLQLNLPIPSILKNKPTCNGLEPILKGFRIRSGLVFTPTCALEGLVLSLQDNVFNSHLFVSNFRWLPIALVPTCNNG